MPNSVDEKHSPSEFYHPGETNYEQNSNKNSQEKVFSGLFYKVRKNCDSTKPYNKSLINLVCSVCTGKFAFGFYRTDLAPSSLGLYENLRQYFPVRTLHSVNKSLV